MQFPSVIKIGETHVETSTKSYKDGYDINPISMTIYIKKDKVPWLMQIWKNRNVVKKMHKRVAPTRSIFAMDKEMKVIRRKANRISTLMADMSIDPTSKVWQLEVDSYCKMVEDRQSKLSKLYGLKNL